MCAAGGIDDNAIEGKLAAHTVWARPGIHFAETVASLGAGGQLAPLLAAGELNGLAMATADEGYFFVDPVGELWMFDLSKDIRAEIMFYSSGGAADTGVIWKLHAQGFADLSTLVDVVVAPDSLITFDTQTITGAEGFDKTNRAGLGEAGTFEDDELIVFALELDASGDASADEIKAICVRLFGTQQITHSSREKQFT